MKLVQPCSTTLYELYIKRLEKQILNWPVDLNLPQDARTYVRRDFEFSRKELKQASFSKDHEILFVGSGPFPITALAYIDSGYKVQCLDYDSEAVRISKDMFYQDEFLRITEGNAFNFDYSQSPQITIAVMVPKEQTIKQIIRTAPKRCTLVIRSTEGLKRLCYPPLDPSLIDTLTQSGFQYVTSVYGDSSQNIVHSLVYKRES